jgi:hypothetical protein
MKLFLLPLLLIISCGKDGAAGINGKDGQDAVVQSETVSLNTGSGCSNTATFTLPTMLTNLCFTYVNPSLRIHPNSGTMCDTTITLFSQNITSTATTTIIVPETGTSFSAAAVNESNTFLFLSRNSGCGVVRAVEFRD